ncbi:MAG: DUF4836 family protein [Bacteroidaceae bacterium]|nr:DUF4836 family protein [Bacteroidaceae bacterium]
MKKYGIIAAIVAVGIAAFIGWKMFHGRGDAMASSLPKDITAVSRLDAKQLALDYGLSLEDIRKLLLLDNDKEMGVDLMTPAYLFTSQGTLGAIIPLSDKGDFCKMLETKGYAVEDQRGMKWCIINGNMLAGIAKDRAMIMGPAVGSEQEQLRNVIYSCIDQSESESGKNTLLYKNLEKRDEPLALATSLEALPQTVLPSSLSRYLGDINLNDLGLSAGLMAKRDRVILNLTPNSENAKIDKAINQFDDILQPLDGSMLAASPTNSILHLEIGLKGEKLLRILRENKVIRTVLLMLNNVFDLDMILKSIDGALAFSLPQIDGDPVLQVKLSDDKFMQNVASWNDAISRAAGFQFYAQDKHRAMLTYKGKPYYFSSNQDMLTISSSEAIANSTGHHDIAYNFADEIKGQRLYASIDLSQFAKKYMNNSESAKMLKAFQRLTISASNSKNLQLQLVLNDGENLLDLLDIESLK